MTLPPDSIPHPEWLQAILTWLDTYKHVLAFSAWAVGVDWATFLRRLRSLGRRESAPNVTRYYHVVLRFADAPEKDSCVFTDLSEKELRERFVKPYRRGKSFMTGSDAVVDSMRIRQTTIVCTNDRSEVELRRIQEKSRREIDELNRTSRHVVFMDLGRGYVPEDITEAGVNVTATFVSGPPGEGDGWSVVTAIINHPSTTAIGTGVLLLWLGYMLGWS